MSEMTRRAAMGLAAAGAAAVVAGSTAEAKSDLYQEIPKSAGRLVGICGGQGNFSMIFENDETGAISVFGYIDLMNRLDLVRTFQRI